MTPERWQKIEQLFDAARALDGAQRAAYLDRECAGDLTLKAEVESLLAAHQQPGPFIDEPAFRLDDRTKSDLRRQEEVAAIRIGKSLGPYEILGLLGVGGMGVVYRARDTRLPREVALKILPQFVSNDSRSLKRFQQEAWAISALNHPNILTIYEFGEANGEQFLAAELVDGATLRNYVGQEDLTLPDVLDLIIQVAGALAAAHERGITHRDIKPGNIMVRKDGYVKVLDFGLAKLAENKSTGDTPLSERLLLTTEPGAVMGTALYMSPEQARGKEVDGRTDVWSLGVILYELLTGRVPFPGDTGSDVIASILKTEPPSLAEYVPGAPAELQRIVKKVLRKRREERYQLARELELDLRNLRREFEIDPELAQAVATGGRRLPRSDGVGGAITRVGAGMAERTGVHDAARRTASVKYLVGGIRRRKLAAVMALTVVVAAVGVIGYRSFSSSRRASLAKSLDKNQPIDSLAVMPFTNASGDPDTEYLCDGIAESLINSLSQLPGLKVISRSSVSRYKGREIDLQTVARELGVRAVLIGKVAQRSDTLIVSAELVDGLDGTQVWGAQYNKKLTDIFVVQEDIARQMSERLRLRLSNEDRRLATKRYTENAESYQLYLKGRFYWNKRTRDGVTQAIDYFQQSISSDPSFALAYSGLADCYIVAFGYQYLSAGDAMARAEVAARQALALDYNLAEPHAASAYIKGFYRGDFAGAEKEFPLALSLNPNYATAHQWYALFLAAVGQSERAVIEIKRAIELDPVSLIINSDAILVYYYTGRYEEGLSQSQKVLEMDPNFSIARDYRALIYVELGRYDEAIDQWKKETRLGAANRVALGHAYAVAGRRQEALRMIEELKRKPGDISGVGLAVIYAGLGQKDEAIASLKQAYQRSSKLSFDIFLNVDPRFKSLHSDPRFVELTRRTRFPS